VTTQLQQKETKTMIEIRIQLDHSDGMPQSAIYFLDVNPNGNRKVVWTWRQSLQEFAAANHPQLDYLFDPAASEQISDELIALTHQYVGTEAMAEILRGGGAADRLCEQVLATMPATVQKRVLELIGASESAPGTVATPIDLIKAFLTEIEAQVQPLYQQAMDLSSANRLEESNR
jgi:hypothetical protein